METLVVLMPGTLRIAGVLGGAALACLRFMDFIPALHLSNDDWAWDAFSGFGAMSGFSLASLAVIAGLANHERAKESLEAEDGRWFVRQLVWAMAAWMIPSLAGLGATLVPDSRYPQMAVILFATIAASQSIVSTVAVIAFFRRFSKPRPE